jgi:hypothetical protein
VTCMRRILPCVLLFSAVLLTACVQLAEIDVTTSPRYRSMIGREFILKEDLKVKGVKRELRSKQPDYAMLEGSPGINGPEFFELGSKRAGSRFTIVGVIVHKSQLFPATAYVVRFADGVAVAPGITDIRISDQNGFRFHDRPPSPDEAPPLSARYFAAVAAR